MKRFFIGLVFLVMFVFAATGSYAAAAEAPAAPALKSDPALKKDTAAPAKDATAPAKGGKPKKEAPKFTPEELAALQEKQLKAVNQQLHMVYVKGGCFEMGDFSGLGDDDELPVHEVCLSDFYISDAEVTQGLWLAVMGFPNNDPYEADKPVVNVSMIFVGRFIESLSKITKKYYRLPNEAEWEFAAREGGLKKRWSGTDHENEIAEYAWFEDNSDGAMHKVKQKKPNAFGLYDMTGNAWEWVDDFFDFEYYKSSPRKQPLGPTISVWRTIRGGSFMDDSIRLRNMYRFALEPDQSKDNLGFRIAE